MNNPIANYIRNIIYSSDKASLHLLPCPTGIGKIYSTVIEIAELLIRKAKDGDWPDNAPKRIWFATDLIENVTDAHRNLIDIIESSDELSKEQKVDAVKYIDYIPSNADCMSKISSQELSEFFISNFKTNFEIYLNENNYKNLLDSGLQLKLIKFINTSINIE